MPFPNLLVSQAGNREHARGFGVDLPHEGAINVTFDDSIIVDTYQEKKQDLSEVGVTMSVAEFRAKWYAESPEVAEEKAAALTAVASDAWLSRFAGRVWQILVRGSDGGAWCLDIGYHCPPAQDFHQW